MKGKNMLISVKGKSVPTDRVKYCSFGTAKGIMLRLYGKGQGRPPIGYFKTLHDNAETNTYLKGLLHSYDQVLKASHISENNLRPFHIIQSVS